MKTWLTASAWAILTATAWSAPPFPFAAHNCYPYLGQGADRLEKAMAAGFDHIEVDVTLANDGQSLLVTHDAKPPGGEPELDAYLEPLWKAWAEAPDGDRTLIIDFKTGSPKAAHLLAQTLAKHKEILSSMPKKAGGTFHARKATVCLTGADSVKVAYDKLIPAGGEYLAFRDVVMGGWKRDPADYVPDEPPGYHRFLTFNYKAFLESPEGSAARGMSPARLRAMQDKATKLGYRVRLYTLNARRLLGRIDPAPWERCVDAGVPMIATDDYALAREWWDKRSESAKPAP